jgi:hypothetical protein
VGETFGVDTDGLSTAASALSNLVTRLSRIYESVSQQLPDPNDVLGDPGQDPIAGAVNKSFMPALGNFLEGMNNMITVLDQTGDGVKTMAGGFSETEEENTDSIKQPTSDPD